MNFGVIFTRPTPITQPTVEPLKIATPIRPCLQRPHLLSFLRNQKSSLTNPTEVDPSLILMTTPKPNHHNVPLFTHNCQIKDELATLILDNDSQRNLISQDFIQHLQTPHHPTPRSISSWLGTEGRSSHYYCYMLHRHFFHWPFS
jgi:hypothetical protein